jgi:DNA processing protein
VVAHGLNQIYLNRIKKYVAKMEENGGFMTEFWSASNPDKENFVRRNRISRYDRSNHRNESADRGGSLITANLANDYNRDVFAVPVALPINTLKAATIIKHKGQCAYQRR